MNTVPKLLAGYKNRCGRRMQAFHLSLLMLVTVVLYWPVHHFQFLIGWDDQWFVTNHFTENGLKWSNLYAILTSFYHGQYAPLNQLYYTSLYCLFGYDPTYYHLAGVLIHLVNVILLYFVINKVCLQVINRPKAVLRTISFMTALLFAVLPFNIEPVAWVGASKVLLYALFYLAALLVYCRYLTYHRPVYYYLTLVFFIFSFGAKEQAVLLPLCLLLFDFIYKRRLWDTTVWLEKLPFFILSLFLGLVTLQSQVFYGTGRIFYPLYQRIPLALFTLMEYFTKSVVPVNLSYVYPWPFLIGEKVPWWMWIYVLAVPGVIYCFYNKLKIRWLLFGLFFFFIHIVLAMNVFSLARYSFIADRYAYLSNAGICFLMSCILVLNYKKVKFKIPLLIVSFLYIGALFTDTKMHLQVWQNAYTLKEKIKNTIESRPDFNQLKKIK